MKLLVFLMSAGVALACTCGTATPEAELASSDFVFTGTAESVESLPLTNGWASKKIRFHVRDVWKGTNASSIILYTAANEIICGYTFLRGTNYLVYARQQKSRAGEPILTTDLCTRTRLLSKAEDDLRVLKKAKGTEK